MWKNSILKENPWVSNTLQFCLNVSEWGNYGVQWRKESQERNSKKSDMKRKSRKNGKHICFPFYCLLHKFLMPYLDLHALSWHGFHPLKPEFKVHRRQGRFSSWLFMVYCLSCYEGDWISFSPFISSYYHFQGYWVLYNKLLSVPIPSVISNLRVLLYSLWVIFNWFSCQLKGTSIILFFSICSSFLFF